jgi:bifunctional UDP-N-acetylglucosamine pyrophosphorylase/glucosamine-1-phosphate N-acetyltransferase
MLSNKAQAIILAAGKSTRFNTGRTKLVEKICGQEMILYATRLFEQLHIPTSIVIGYQQELIRTVIGKYHGSSISYSVQEEQKGTGHALLCAKNKWEREHIIIMNGDVPLVTEKIISDLFDKHIQTDSDISFVIAHNPDPANGSYGRVIQNAKNIKIIEARDFVGDINEQCCINAGIYICKRKFLEETINSLQQNQKSHEFYLTDLINIASDQHRVISTVHAPFDLIRGINNFQELWAAEQIKRAELIKYWMDRGVHFSVAQNVHIDLTVSIGAGSYIGCGVHLLGKTSIGKNCKINEFSSLEDTKLADDITIFSHSILQNSSIGANSQIGPFAHISEQSIIGDNNIIGNFVEVKRSLIGDGTKAKHLAYIGDTTIGTKVNIGAGTVICNHNGKGKQKTEIGNRAFIGSNSTLVAPLKIGDESFVAAASVITDDVPAGALAIARARQANKEDYARKLVKTTECTFDSTESSGAFLGAIKPKNKTSPS